MSEPIKFPVVNPKAAPRGMTHERRMITSSLSDMGPEVKSTMLDRMEPRMLRLAEELELVINQALVAKASLVEVSYVPSVPSMDKGDKVAPGYRFMVTLYKRSWVAALLRPVNLFFLKLRLERMKRKQATNE